MAVGPAWTRLRRRAIFVAFCLSSIVLSYTATADNLVDLRELIADGKSHTLASVGARSLADWKALFPAATNLADELDWVVLQSNIDVKKDIILPAGKLVINHALNLCSKSIRMWGKGENLTFVKQLRTGEAGIESCAANRAAEDSIASIDIRGLSFLCGAEQGCGDAVVVRGGSGFGWNYLSGLTISPDEGRWTGGVHTLAASKTIIQDLVINGSYSPLRDDNDTKGITIESVKYGRNRESNASFGTFIYNTEIYGWGVCMDFRTVSFNGVEGAYVDHSSCDASNSFLTQRNSVYEPPQNYYQAPLYNIINNQVHVRKFAAKFQAASQVNIMNNVFYIDPGSVIDDWLLFRSVTDLIIANNHFSAYPASSIRTIISMIRSVNASIHDNIFDNGLGQLHVAVAGIYADNYSLNIQEHNNIWSNWQATGVPETRR